MNLSDEKKEKMRAYKKQYYQRMKNNPEFKRKEAEYKKQYYQRERLKRLEYQKKYDAIHSEEKKERLKLYYQKNKEYYIEKNREYKYNLRVKEIKETLLEVGKKIHRILKLVKILKNSKKNFNANI